MTYDLFLYIGQQITHWSLVITITVLPLAVFRRTRIVTGVTWRWMSFVFAGLLWVESLITTYLLAGLFWTIFGVITLIGVVPIAFIACIFRGYWDGLLELVLTLVTTLGLRFLAALMIATVDSQD